MKDKIKNLFILFLTMFKIGLFTFGGGYAMITLLKREFTEKKDWLTDDEMLAMITIAESTPGPIAINMSTFIGFKLYKVLGAFVATLGVVLPSFLIIVIISLFLKNIMDYEIVKNAFVGINCAVSILIGRAFFVLKKGLKKNIVSYILFTFSLISTFFIIFFNLNISTIYLILIGCFTSLIYHIVLVKLNKEVEK
jgi:chromate transporter